MFPRLRGQLLGTVGNRIAGLTSPIELMRVSAAMQKTPNKFWSGYALGLVLWGILLLVLTIRNILRPNGLHDMGVYLTAAWHWIDGAALYTYRQNIGFVYSPFAAICYTPFTLVPPFIARTLWQIFSAGILLTGLAGLCKYGPFTHITQRALAFLLLLPLSVDNLLESQANALVIGCIMIAFAAASRECWTVAAIAIGVAAYWKVYPVVVGMLLILVAPTKIIWRLFLVFLAMALIPFVCQNSPYVLDQYQLWYSTRTHDNRLQFPLKIAPFDLWYLLVRWGGLAISETFYRILQISSGAAIALFCIFGQLRKWPRERILGGMFSFVCVWILLFGPASENETYLLLAPAVILGLLECFSRPSPMICRFLVLSAYLLLLFSMTVREAVFSQPRPLLLQTLQPFAALFFLGYALLHYCRPSEGSFSRHDGI